jgi:hypothetical protein
MLATMADGNVPDRHNQLNVCPATAHTAPPYTALQEAVLSSVAVVFQWALPAIVLAFLVSLLLHEIPLRDDVNVSSAAIEGTGEASFGVLGEPGPRGTDEGHDDWRAPSSASSAHVPTVLE